MNGSDSQQNDHQAQSVFQNMTMTSVGLIPESFKVDLDQDDENSDASRIAEATDLQTQVDEKDLQVANVAKKFAYEDMDTVELMMGLMPHVDAMAMAAESSTGSAAVSKQPSAICIQPATAVTYQGDSFNISSAQVPSAASAGNVFQNVITYVAIPANFTPITVPITNIPQVNIESKPVIENVATLPVTTAPPLSEPITDEHWMEHDTPTSSMTCSVNEFLKTSRRKPNVDVKEEEVPASEDNAEVAGKLKKLEVRTLYVDFEKRKSDMIVLKEKFPSTNARQLDSLYMKMGCDLDRTVESLTQKMEEEQAKKLKALEEWRRNYDKNKVIKRVAAKNTVPPVTKRAKFDESGNEVYSPSANRPSTPDNQNLMYPNKRIPSDVRVYKQFFKRVEATDTGSKINAFMERNVVEYPASESEESARPVKMRTHVRHDYSPCVPRTTNNNSLSIFGTPNVTIDNSNSESTPTVTTSSAPPTTVSEANISQIEQSAQQTQQASVVPTAPVVVKKEEPRIGTGANIPSAATVSSGVLHTATKSESPLVSNEADGTDTEKSVSMLGLDDDNSCDHMDDDVEDDRLSDTSSNTRLSNSSGSGAVWPNKFFKNKITTAAAIHKRAYVSRELSQAWTGNKRVVPHNNPILEMTGNPAAISHSTPTMKGKSRPRVWTASSDAIPVNPGKLINSYGSPYTPHLKIPTDSVESSPAPESFSASPDVKPIPVSPGDQLGDRSTVLDFFNTSEVEDIAAISNCSRKKANVIISMRPFLSLKDLSTRLDRERSLSSTLISGCKELLQMRASVSRLLMKCQKISNTVMPRISALTDQLNMESADSSQMQTTWDQPDCLNKEMSLKPYQILGVKWLKLLHSMNLNGILADEMGLGKTVQTIAFLASLMEMGDKGPHLVIVPSTTLENWCREFDIWCPSLRVLLYYGSFEERKAMRKEVYESGNSDFNIILTTYSVATSSIEDRTMMKRLDIHYGIFDEAHMLKNMTSQRYRYLMTFKIQRRLLLTGTPLQNNLLELMSLLSFVMPSLFAHRETTEVLKRLFQTCSRFRDDKTDASGGNLQTLSYEKQRILQAKSLLRPFILRRMKIHVLSQLPPKVDIVERVALPPVQRLRYVDLVTEIKDQLRRSGPDQESTSMAMLMQLRKAANHTLLHRRVFTNEMLREMARTLKKKEPSHKKAKEQLIYEDLCVLNDFEIHKICELYKED